MIIDIKAGRKNKHMADIPWVMVWMVIILLLLAAVSLALRRKEKKPADYFSFFTMGAIWLAIGLPLGNPGLWFLGLVFMAAGLAHRKEWKKNRKGWKRLGRNERVMLAAAIASGAAFLAMGLLIYFSMV